MRRGLRCASPSSAAAEPAVTLDDIYARHAWLWWWDGAHGVDAGADTWTDRVGSHVLAGSSYDLTSSTLGGQACALWTPTEWLPDDPGVFAGNCVAPTDAGLAMQAFRMFAVVSIPDMSTASSGAWFAWGNASDNLLLSCDARWPNAYVNASQGNETSTREGADYDDGSTRVIRWGFNMSHASHVLRVNGTAYTAATSTENPSPFYADPGYIAFNSGGFAPTALATRVVALFACAYATIDDTQAAQVETDLLTIMGL